MSKTESQIEEPEFPKPKNVELKIPPPGPHVELTSNMTAGAVDDVIYSALKGVRRYKIVRASPEKLDEWKREVDEIIKVITTKDLRQLRELIKKGNHLRYDVHTVEKIISEEILDETDIKLLAIGLFFLREKTPWDARKSGLKIIKGGRVRMESAFEQEGWANCYDSAAIVRELASMYGIKGGMQSKGFHSHFETEEGKVSDPMYGWKRGGLFQTKEKFEAFTKEMGFFKRRGLKK